MQVRKISHNRHYNIGKGLRAHRCVLQAVVLLDKFFVCRVFMIENLHNLLALHHFLDVAVQIAQRRLLSAEVPRAFAADLFYYKKHQKQHQNDKYCQERA